MGRRKNGEEAALRRVRELLRDAPEAGLKSARVEAGLSQSALARELATSQTLISDIENGRRDLTSAMARRISAALNSAEGSRLEEPMTPSQLEARHLVGQLAEMVRKDPDELSAELLAALISWLDGKLPETDASGDLMDALLGLLAEKTAAFRKARKRPAEVAAKSADGGGEARRDGFGRRRQKPTTRPR